MATVAEITDQLAATLVPVPSAGAGICRICHRRSGDYSRCYSCRSIRDSLTYPCDRVVPITLMGNPSQPYTMLKGYKGNSSARKHFATQIAALVARFLRDHGSCIAEESGGSWDVITHVPSKGRHAGEHPLVRVTRRVAWLGDQHETLLSPGPGIGDISRTDGADDGFEAVGNVSGRRVLVIDDTWTTGATSQSAASALTFAGATVVAVVPVGRLVSPGQGYDGAEANNAWWKSQRDLVFDFDACCLE